MLLNLLIYYYELKKLISQAKYKKTKLKHETKMSDLPKLVTLCNYGITTGWERLIQSHSSARFCFELSGNLN